MSDNVSFWVKLRRWFQPYYNPKPKVESKSTGKVRKKKTIPKSMTKKNVKRDLAMVQANKKLVIPVITYPNKLENAMTFKQKPSLNKIWYYHDENRHQIFCHLDTGSGFVHKGRDDSARKKLKPLLYPRQDAPFDRTHVLPIGYHGSENDNRLVVGWDSSQNRNELNYFEQKAKKIKEPIYWLTDIRKTPTGATWTYRIYSVNTGHVLQEITLEMNTRFQWVK